MCQQALGPPPPALGCIETQSHGPDVRACPAAACVAATAAAAAVLLQATEASWVRRALRSMWVRWRLRAWRRCLRGCGWCTSVLRKWTAASSSTPSVPLGASLTRGNWRVMQASRVAGTLQRSGTPWTLRPKALTESLEGVLGGHLVCVWGGGCRLQPPPASCNLMQPQGRTCVRQVAQSAGYGRALRRALVSPLCANLACLWRRHTGCCEECGWSAATGEQHCGAVSGWFCPAHSCCCVWCLCSAMPALLRTTAATTGAGRVSAWQCHLDSWVCSSLLRCC